MKVLVRSDWKHRFPSRYAACKIGSAILLLAACIIIQATESQSATITSNLSISGTAAFDVGSAQADGNVTQTGNFSTTQGGVTTVSTFSGTTVTGDNPLPGTLTDIGDGFGMEADVDAQYESEFEVVMDIDISVKNNSATVPYRVTFGLDFSNIVNSMGTPEVDDAFSESEFVVDVDDNEVFFSDLLSDLLNGNEIDGDDTGDFGGQLDDSGMESFIIEIDPSSTVLIEGILQIDGGVFSPEASALADFSASINVQNVAAVPLPTAIVLFGSGLTGLAVVRCRKKKTA